MTDREKAIVMAHTGICMLTGDKFQIFHKYVEDIMGRPIFTHEIGWLADTIKEKSKADFIELCADESNSEKPNKWIPVSEELPDKEGYYLCSVRYMYPPYNFFEPEKVKYMDDVTIQKFDGEFNIEVKAWMPLPLPWEGE